MSSFLVAIALGCSLGNAGAFFAPSRQGLSFGATPSASRDDAQSTPHLQAKEAAFCSEDDDTTLELDSKGCLRIGNEGIQFIDGLSPSLWSATRPEACDGKKNSIFLHTHHPKSSSEHDTHLSLASYRFLACSRVTRYWMGPCWGNCANDVPLDTQFLLVEVSKGGPYALLLPLVDDNFRASLQKGGGQNELVCHEESGDNSVLSSGMKAIFVSVGDDPFEVVKSGFAQVAKETGTFLTLDQKKLPNSVDDFGWCTWDAFYSEVAPEGVLDGVSSLCAAGVQPRTVIIDDGWQQVTPLKKANHINADTKGQSEDIPVDSSESFSVVGRILAILSKIIEAFYNAFVKRARHNSIPNRIWRFLTSTMLKGQMWEYFDTDTDFARQLSGWLPNSKFQQNRGSASGLDMKSLVTKLKNELGVKTVICWHALNGYWRGVSPDLGARAGIDVTDAMPQPSRHLLSVEPQLAWDAVSLFGVGLLTSKADLTKFYDCLHEPLIQAGVDGVKVDVQSGVPAVAGGVGGGPHIARLYSEGLEASISDRFSTADGAARCINCMCHSTENLYRYKATSIARASDDFYPRRPSSHSVHLVNVAYNSLFIGEICLPDWDMFHSKHESAGLHAAARAVGGCPVYVSDAPGRHDPALLKRLVLPDGTVLRAKLPGRPTRDCLFRDVGKDGTTVLKVWNANVHSSVVGAFHVQGVSWNFDTHENEVVDDSPGVLSAAIEPHDAETMREEEGPFAVWSHRTSAISVLPSGGSSLEIELSHREWEIFTIVPIQFSGSGVAWAPIGLGDMLNTGGALTEARGFGTSGSDTVAGTVMADFSSRGPGRFVAYCQPEPTKVLIDGVALAEIPFSHEAESGLLSFSLPSEKNRPHRVKVVWGE